MSTLQPPCTELHLLSESIRTSQRKASQALLRELSAFIPPVDSLLSALPKALRSGSEQSYTRHIAYADPHGTFTIAYLIWRPGQFSPVHGHKTWCTYQVLVGELSETHYHWNHQTAMAIAHGQVCRRPGDIVTAAQGLHQIHKLGNAGAEVAISLHIYGVAQTDLCSNLNLLIDRVDESALPTLSALRHHIR